MTPEMIAALALMTLTDRFFQQSCPPGTDLTSWRAKVKAFADDEELWLKSILKK